MDVCCGDGDRVNTEPGNINYNIPDILHGYHCFISTLDTTFLLLEQQKRVVVLEVPGPGLRPVRGCGRLARLVPAAREPRQLLHGQAEVRPRVRALVQRGATRHFCTRRY